GASAGPREDIRMFARNMRPDRWLIPVLLAATAAGIAVAQGPGGGRMMDGPRQGGPRGPMQGGPGGPMMMGPVTAANVPPPVLAKALNLSDEQIRRIAAIHEEIREQREALRPERGQRAEGPPSAAER